MLTESGFDPELVEAVESNGVVLPTPDPENHSEEGLPGEITG